MGLLNRGVLMLETAVAFFVFNRPETTRRVFERIRAAQPRRLLVVADGPRPDRPGEPERCAEVRRLIAAGVDWPCEVSQNYADRNLGCGRRVASGLDWVFAQVEEAIILEDDCLPDPTFFRFCSELLDRYRDDPRIGMISGCNLGYDGARDRASYFFSAYNFIWGWAAWRRSWARFDQAMRRWPELRNTPLLREWLRNRPAAAYWSDLFDETFAGKIDTWDYPWALTLWVNSLLTIVPATNLVTNIGLGPGGTHTGADDKWLCRPAAAMTFPLRHPAAATRDVPADRYFEQHVYRIRWKHVLKHWLKGHGLYWRH